MRRKDKSCSCKPSGAHGQIQPDPAWKSGKAIQGLVLGLVLLQDCWALNRSSDCISLHADASSADVATSPHMRMRKTLVPKAPGSQTLSCAAPECVRLVMYQTPGPSRGCAEAGEGWDSTEQSWELGVGPDPGVGCAVVQCLAVSWTWKVLCVGRGAERTP